MAVNQVHVALEREEARPLVGAGGFAVKRKPHSEILAARRRARTLKEFYSCFKSHELKELVRTAIALSDEVERFREALRSIQSFPKNPSAAVEAMQDIARAALSPNKQAERPEASNV
jgi:hypothetical protein